MRKEVTIGPDIIDYFYECGMDLTEPNTFGPLMLQLRKDTIMWNSKIEYLINDNIWENYISHAEGAMSVLIDMGLEKMYKKVVEDIDEINLVKLTAEDKVEYALVEASKDKIWLKSEENKKRLEIRDQEKQKAKSPETKKEKKKLYGSIVLPKSFKDYSKQLEVKKDMVGPIKIGKNYKHFPGDKFPFKEYVEIVLKNAKYIDIEEPYMFHNRSINDRKKHYNFSVENVEFIASLVSKRTKIKISTLHKFKYSYLQQRFRCDLCYEYIIKEEFEAHVDQCSGTLIPEAVDIEPSDEIKMVSCSACLETMIEKGGEFKVHADQCSDAVIPEAVDIEPSDEIKMVSCSACLETMIEKDGEFKVHADQCSDAVIPEAVDIESSDAIKMVSCSACLETMIEKDGEFKVHADQCSDAVIPEAVDIESSDAIKMVSCLACLETMIEKDGEFNDHKEECPGKIIPKPLDIEDYDPVKEIIDELESKYDNITFKIDNKVHDRYLRTDKYEISLGAGLSAYRDNKVWVNSHFIVLDNSAKV